MDDLAHPCQSGSLSALLYWLISIIAQADTQPGRSPINPPRTKKSPMSFGADPDSNLWSAPGRVRLNTLITLRWLAIAGQAAAVLIVEFGFGFATPLFPTLAVIAFSACVNIALTVARPSQGLVREGEAMVQLGFDVLQLTALLWMTGGVENPFLLLFIAPVAVSAAVLRPFATAILTLLVVVCVLFLSASHWPLPWKPSGAFTLPATYQLGLATAVLIGLAFTSVYAWRVAQEEERLNVALAAVQTVLAREQQLSALGGLAAAAAHELGTPLATIHLVAKEMAGHVPKDSPLAEDVALLISQSERCRVILKQLSSRRNQGDMMHERMPLQGLLDEVCGPHRGLGTKVTIKLEAAESAARPPDIKRLPEVIHGLGNLVENAVGFAATEVEVIARWTPVELEISVRDDGPGFPPHLLARLGEPYVSERGAESRGGGMGLGFFIAKTLLEKTSARLTVQNRAAPRTGAVVRATWPRAAVEAPAQLG
jgi:two-component system, sensor histidine kinase RegB